MLTAVVSTACYIPFSLYDDANVAVTGKANGDFTKKAKLRNVGTEITPTVTEDEEGDYDVIFTPTAVGTWHVRWSVSVDGETVRFEEIVQVSAAVVAADSAAVIAATVLGASVSGYATGTVGHRLARIGAGSTLVAAPVAESGDVRIYKGDDYAVADGTALEWQLTGAPDLTGATVTLTITSKSVALPKTCTLDDEGETTQLVFAELTDAQTDTLSPSEVTRYVLRAVLAGGSVATLATGRVTVVDE